MRTSVTKYHTGKLDRYQLLQYSSHS
ncbi:Protein of unknown function [Pyronema omphalodes CBS 100304]|uniref:Uncharacterized protein n=1 Tax=Pyronema omphalodes (strain CBS 100304) TaxID=1076935 RepID=U4KY50_PYROM|nr:Protein of unknown function [Pyronema omphalodes CBS 100304]